MTASASSWAVVLGEAAAVVAAAAVVDLAGDLTLLVFGMAAGDTLLEAWRVMG